MGDEYLVASVGGCTLYRGDALDVLRQMPACSMDAVVTDPPAGISFMGKGWDGDKGGRDGWVAYMAERFAEALRVTKPGGHALVWALPRTSHWTTMALEDAGWEIRDVVVHLFGSGFPKSLDVSKAIDKAAGAEREVTKAGVRKIGFPGQFTPISSDRRERRDIPATDAAREWEGWGTALKPASEHWILARKPLRGTVAANVLEHGTGAINIAACRVGLEERENGGGSTSSLHRKTRVEQGYRHDDGVGPGSAPSVVTGRWPANVVLSCWCETDEHEPGCPVRLLDEQSGTLTSGTGAIRRREGYFGAGDARHGGLGRAGDVQTTYGDTGGASRFFYVAKPSTAERNARGAASNSHPTVKPVELMRYLTRLVTPRGGHVLDLFGGSGTTGVACIVEGFRCTTIEADFEEGSCDTATLRWTDAVGPLFATL